MAIRIEKTKNKLSNKQKQTVNVKINIADLKRKARRGKKVPKYTPAQGQKYEQGQKYAQPNPLYIQMPSIFQDNGLFENLKTTLKNSLLNQVPVPLTIPSTPSAPSVPFPSAPPVPFPPVPSVPPPSVRPPPSTPPSIPVPTSLSDYSDENPLLRQTTPTKNLLFSQIPQSKDISREDGVKPYKDKSEYRIGGSLPEDVYGRPEDIGVPIIVAGRQMTHRKAHENEPGYIHNYLTGRWVREKGRRGMDITRLFGSDK